MRRVDNPPARPVALDLCVGLGGWTTGLIAEGWHVIGVDIEDMFAALSEPKPEHFELRIEDICNVRGADYAHVDLIVGSSPCQDFSYRAMPWKRAKALHAPFLGMFLFWQQFRIQREACQAAGRYIPMVVENVRGAQPWVGRAKGNYGSYYLWGDVPALLPMVLGGGGRARQKTHQGEQWNINRKNFTGPLGWDLSERGDDGLKNPGFRFDGSGKSFQTDSVERHTPLEGRKNGGGSWFNIGSPGQKVVGQNPVEQLTREGFKNRDADGYERTHPNAFGWKAPRTSSGAKAARKAASAKIAKIPLTISSHIGAIYLPGGTYAPARPFLTPVPHATNPPEKDASCPTPQSPS